MKDQIYNRLLEERIVFLSGEVRDDMANMVVRNCFFCHH
jgi:ATP-dependent Clp protease, protease subunit